jgi:hypothetical protein
MRPHGSCNIFAMKPLFFFLFPHLSSKSGSRASQAGGGGDDDEEGDICRDVNRPTIP